MEHYIKIGISCLIGSNLIYSSSVYKQKELKRRQVSLKNIKEISKDSNQL